MCSDKKRQKYQKSCLFMQVVQCLKTENLWRELIATELGKKKGLS